MTDHRPLHHCRPPITHVHHPRYNVSWVVGCCMWRWWVTMVASGVHQGGGECWSVLTKYNASHLWTPQHHCHSLASKEFDGEWWIDDQCQCQLPRSVLTSPLKIDHYFDWQHWTANSSYIHEIRLSPPHVAIIHIILRNWPPPNPSSTNIRLSRLLFLPLPPEREFHFMLIESNAAGFWSCRTLLEACGALLAVTTPRHHTYIMFYIFKTID